MNWGPYCWLALLVALLAGCRTDPGQVLLERELRLQEDKIYQLQFHLEELHERLAACRHENAELKDRLGIAPAAELPDRPAPRRGVPPAGRARTPQGPTGSPSAPRLPVPLPENDVPAPPTIEPGVEVEIEPGVEIDVEPGQEVSPEELPDLPGTADAPQLDGDSSWQLQLENDGSTVARPAARRTALAESRDAQWITLDAEQTGGFDTDGQPGSDGITISLQPRDADGQSISAAAAVSVVVIDPQEKGQAARVARWDLSTEEIAQVLDASGNRSVHLQLEWPAQPPKHPLIRVFARYITEDGRKLEANLDVDLRRSANLTTAKWIRAKPRHPAGDLGGHSAPQVAESSPLESPFGDERVVQQPSTGTPTTSPARSYQ